MLSAVRASLLYGDQPAGGPAVPALLRHAQGPRLQQVRSSLGLEDTNQLPPHRMQKPHIIELNIAEDLTFFPAPFNIFSLSLFLSCSFYLSPLISAQIKTEVFLHLRYEGTDCALMVTATGYPGNSQSCRAGDFRSAFTQR